MTEWKVHLQRLLDDRRRGSLQILSLFVDMCHRLTKAGSPGDELRHALRLLTEAHPAMALLWNLRARFEALGDAPSDVLAQEAALFLRRVHQQSEAAAQKLAAHIPQGATILTHSAGSQMRSFLRACLKLGKGIRLLCTISEPGGEGVQLARWAHKHGLPVMLLAEAQVIALMPEIHLFLVGSDALCFDGIVHKVGTALLAYHVWLEHRPVWVLSCSAKVFARPWGDDLAGVAPPLRRLPLPQATPLYDCTPWEYVSTVATEEGIEPAASFRERSGLLPDRG